MIWLIWLRLIISLILLVIIFFYLAYLVEHEINLHSKDRVIYYGSNISKEGALVADIINRYIGKENTHHYTLVEPGAGLGKMVVYLAKQFVWKDVQAVERSWIISTLGRMYCVWFRASVIWLRVNMFTTPFPKKAVMYCYLFPALMDRLYKEIRLAGRLVISLTFPIDGVEPTEKIEFPDWQSPLWVYDFRD